MGALLLLAWLACTAHRAPVAEAPAAGGAPVLPAPRAARYATGPARPRDPLVARLVEEGGLPWEESLAGAAAGLLLDEDHPDDLAYARWAAVLAGYPYPVVEVLGGEVGPDEYPAELPAALRARVGPDVDLGVVRARRSGRDRWLVLVGRRVLRLEPFPREIELGDPLTLRADRPARWTAVSPSGQLFEGELPAELVPQEDGEWWLEVRRAEDGALACSLPFYVGTDTPEAPWFELPGAAAGTPSEAREIALGLLYGLREQFGLPRLERDPLVAALSERPLEWLLSGTWDRERAERRLVGGGVTGGPVAALACEAPTVALCLDALMRRPADRAALLDRRMRAVGLAVYLDTRRVALALGFASE